MFAGKNRRLKQAKEEAQAEIEQYRLQREKDFKTKEAAVSSSSSSSISSSSSCSHSSFCAPPRLSVPMVTAPWRWTGTLLSEWAVSRTVTAVTGRRCSASCCGVSATSSQSFTPTTVWRAEGWAQRHGRGWGRCFYSESVCFLFVPATPSCCFCLQSIYMSKSNVCLFFLLNLTK